MNLLEREGYPAEDEFVLVSVTKVNPSSVFVVLDHYGKKTALIHISEVSPGRIRNIRDYVQEGKKAICKVLKVDEEKGHIDVSLRRVTEIQKRNFNEDVKQEQRAGKLIEQFMSENKIKNSDDLLNPIYEQYDYVFEFFKDFVEDKTPMLVKGDVGKKFGKLIKEKIHPPAVVLKSKLKIQFFHSGGIDTLKKVLSTVEDEVSSITYMGAGAYTLEIKSKDYKSGEKLMKSKKENLEKQVLKGDGFFAIEK